MTRWLVAALLVSTYASGAAGISHERVRLRNNFQSPQEVVAYYCARDASGFVWSGLLDAERAAFTLWHEAPQADSFLVASRYDVGQPQLQGKDHAFVDVKYQLTALADAHGTRSPPPDAMRVVRFDLKKVGAVWKIEKPGPEALSPIVLESKFPFARSQP